MDKEKVKVETLVPLPVEKVWKLWNTPTHITKWNFASSDWHTPAAVNDLKAGGNFSYRMEAKDASEGFDFEGQYEEVVENKFLKYKLTDGRQVEVVFKPVDNATYIEETFEAETQNAIEVQRQGWQEILENFRRYAEKNI